MASPNQWHPNPVDGWADSGPVDPETDICCCCCCCPCLKPKPDKRRDAPNVQPWQGKVDIPKGNNNKGEKRDERNDESDAPKVQQWQGTVDIPKGNSNGSKKPDERSDAPKVQQWQGTVDIPKGNSNGSNKNTWSDNMQPEKMVGRNRWSTRNPDYDSGQVDPGPDNCCCSWLKPKSKTEDTNREGKGKEYSNGGNKNEWFVPISSSPGVSRDQQGTVKSNNYMEIDPIDTAMNGALKEKQVWTQDQENSHGISGNKKPSSQQEDYRPQEIKKNGKYMTPNAANVTKSKDQGYSEEENIASHGGTRPKKTISSTVEQASTLKEIKNRQEVILEDHHKGVHKPEYNHGIHRDTGPDLTKEESSSPEQAAGVQKGRETKGNKRHQQ